MKKIFLLIVLAAFLFGSLAACNKTEPYTSEPVSEPYSEESSFAESVTDESLDEIIDGDGYEDTFEHNGDTYTRLMGNIFLVSSMEAPSKIWNSKTELGKSFVASKLDKVETLASDRVLAASRYNDLYKLTVVDDKGEVKSVTDEITSYKIADGRIFMTYKKDSQQRTVIANSDGIYNEELYYHTVSQKAPEDTEYEYLGWRDNCLYAIDFENDMATETEIKPLSESKETINGIEIVIRNYEKLLPDSNNFCGGYWIYLNGKTVEEYYDASFSRQYVAEKPIISNGHILANAEGGTVFGYPLNSDQEPVCLLNPKFRENSEYMIAKDTTVMTDPYIIMNKDGKVVYSENVESEINDQGDWVFYQYKSMEFDMESENPNAIIIVDHKGETIKTTIEKLIG